MVDFHLRLLRLVYQDRVEGEEVEVLADHYHLEFQVVGIDFHLLRNRQHLESTDCYLAVDIDSDTGGLGKRVAVAVVGVVAVAVVAVVAVVGVGAVAVVAVIGGGSCA